MICQNCGKSLPSNTVVCPNCKMQPKMTNFYNNKMGENGKRAEYITEKYAMKKGIYEGKHTNSNKNLFLGMILVLFVLFLLIVIAIVNYLL